MDQGSLSQQTMNEGQEGCLKGDLKSGIDSQSGHGGSAVYMGQRMHVPHGVRGRRPWGEGREEGQG
jgi:hypothetical protein